MTFNQFAAVLRARWILAVSILSVVVVATLGISLWLPKRYTATATVLAEVKPDPIVGTVPSMQQASSFIATQIDIIQSDRVAQRVANKLKLSEAPQFREMWEQETGRRGSFDAWIGAWLKKNLDVKPSRESSVISVNFQFPDAHFATIVANAFVNTYIDVALELRVDPAKQYLGFFDERVKKARQELEKAQSKLTDFQRAKGMIATDERLDVETMRLNELAAQLVSLRGLGADANSRAGQAKQADKLQDVITNPVIGGLKTELARNEATLQQLQARYGDNHPQVIETKANVASLKARIDSETQRIAGSVGLTNTISRAREAEVQVAYDAQHSRLLKLKTERDEASLLSKEVESSQRAYDALLARESQTNLESNQSTQTNVAILTLADEPYEPSSPKIFLNTLVALILGLLLAIGGVLMYEGLDRRIRTPEDVVQGLDVPVISIVPGNKPATLFRVKSIVRFGVGAGIPSRIGNASTGKA
jgi:chain length determinant protein EpsF